VPPGLDAETIARLVARHGSLQAAAEKAKRDPRFAQAFREATSDQVMSLAYGDNAAATAEYWRLVAAWDHLDGEAEHHPVEGSGAFLPFTLIERALRMHVRDGRGRRTLAAAFPGLTEWTASQLLRWYRVGKPDGLWLDEGDRLQVGARLAPTRDGVRLPRI
jgi:hypothetical protein